MRYVKNRYTHPGYRNAFVLVGDYRLGNTICVFR